MNSFKVLGGEQLNIYSGCLKQHRKTGKTAIFLFIYNDIFPVDQLEFLDGNSLPVPTE
ncbi:25722e9a-a81a-488f-9eca-6208807d40cf [Sclerotinia trifoliorum]|uniref:25722e9a-a81a-488f-9eca-6208807d40cf n=1 Tax=Sclerotinia trifoliorum TaxID=28548 RepID=A0A8H2VU71_9HELO|nr:25722e9a-a81a-488f-9eca-6208807d40cf [Sclerotinia trifoliorum]